MQSCHLQWKANLMGALIFVFLFYFFFSCDQAALWMVQSICLSVCLSVRLSVRLSVWLSVLSVLSVCPSVTPFSLCSHHRIIITNDKSDVKVRGQRSRSQRSKPHLAVSGLWLQFEFTYGNEIMLKAWCCLGEVPYCFSRSSVKFQGHTTKKLSILTQIGHFQPVTPVWSYQFGHEMMHKAWSNIGKVPYCFSMSSVKFQGPTGQKITDFDPNRAFPDCNSSLNSPMALKWCTKLNVV